MIRQITVAGLGLIGGSIALALRRYGFDGRLVGCDRAAVLERALASQVVDGGDEDPVRASQGSDLVVLATPVGAILDLIERLGPVLPPSTLLTDVGSTKQEIAARARAVFGQAAAQRFLPGHPMAGKEHSGLEHADADLFQGAVWLFTLFEERAPEVGVAAEWLRWIERMGARPELLALAEHDHLLAWISHLPQMLSTATAATLADEFGFDPAIAAVGGRALRELTRIGASPYSMWRDIAFTNTENIADALLALEQRLAHLRENLRSPELRAEFEKANRFTAAAETHRGEEGK